MTLSEIRKLARESLSNKWGTAALSVFMFYIIMFAVSIVYVILNYIPFVSILAYAGMIAIICPISFGLVFSLIELKNGNIVDSTDFLNLAFSNFKRIWYIIGNIFKKLWLYILIYFLICFLGTIFCTFILIFGIAIKSIVMTVLGAILIFILLAGIIVSYIFLFMKSLLYSLSPFIAWDNPEMPAKYVVTRSEYLMKGYRGKLFLLYLSFIGWIMLSGLTLGIGFLWLLPYMETSFIIFYENRLKECKNDNDKDPNTIDNSNFNKKIDSITEINEKDIAKIDILDDNGNIIK